MPELANMRVGSLRGTSGEEATTSCPCFRKKSRKVERSCARPVMRIRPVEFGCAVLGIEGAPVHPQHGPVQSSGEAQALLTMSSKTEKASSRGKEDADRCEAHTLPAWGWVR